MTYVIENLVRSVEEETKIIKENVIKMDVSLVDEQLVNSRLKLSEMKIKMSHLKDELTKNKDQDTNYQLTEKLTKESELVNSILLLHEYYNKKEINSNELMDNLSQLLQINHSNILEKSRKPNSGLFSINLEQDIFNNLLQDVSSFGKNKKIYLKKLIELERFSLF